MTRRILPVLAGVLLAAPAFAEPKQADLQRLRDKSRVRLEWAERYQDARHGPETTERFSRTVRVGRSGALDLSNVSGDITITGGGGDEVRIEAVKRVRSRDESNVKALLDELRIEVTELSNRVEVRTIYPRSRRSYSGTVDYTVSVPAGGSVTARSVSGDVRVSNVNGEVRAESVSGDIVTSRAGRLALVKSVSGDIEISEATAEGQVTVSAVSGSVTARGLKVRTLDLGSVSGDLLLTDVAAERVMVKTVSGNLEYAGPLARSGRYEMTSHSGDVRLAVSGTTGFELDATTFSGNVRSDFPLTLRTGPDEDDRRGRRSRSIRGTYGDASAIVDLNSFSGDIVISKR